MNFGGACRQIRGARKVEHGFAGSRKVRFDKDIAIEVLDHTVGVFNGAFRSHDRQFVQDDIAHDKFAVHVDDGIVRGVKKTNLGTANISDDIGVRLGDDHVGDIAFDEPTLHKYNLSGLLGFLGGGFSGGFLGTVPSEEEDAD